MLAELGFHYRMLPLPCAEQGTIKPTKKVGSFITRYLKGLGLARVAILLHIRSECQPDHPIPPAGHE